MAFRGRGRGRGGGGGFGARQQKFELFPELHDEQNLPKASSVKEEKAALMLWSHRLQTFWNSSVYYLEDKRIKKEESADIERFSDRGKKRTFQKDKLSDFIKCTVEYVPAELAQDLKSVRHGRKKVRWNQDSGLKKFDLFEKLEQKVQNEKGGKGKEEDENEEEDDEIIEEEEEDFSDDDYNQNVDFDDDEDDFNMPEDNDNDEGLY